DRHPADRAGSVPADGGQAALGPHSCARGGLHTKLWPPPGVEAPMDCPRCRTRNSEGSRFCESCGAALTAVCPSCGSSTLRGARFCGECGKPTPPAHIAARPPLHLASLLPQWRASLEGERKLVTIMFADIKGSLELLTARDPEEAVVLLDPVIVLMKTALQRYEGTADQIMGA